MLLDLVRITCCKHSLFRIFTHEKCSRLHVQQDSRIDLSYTQNTTNQYLGVLTIFTEKTDWCDRCIMVSDFPKITETTRCSHLVHAIWIMSSIMSRKIQYYWLFCQNGGRQLY